MNALAMLKLVALAAVGAAVYASFRLDFDIRPIREVAHASQRTVVPAKVSGVKQPLTGDDVAANEARPLFNASRRPFVAKVVQVAAQRSIDNIAPKVPVAPRRIRLLGVNIFGTSASALLQNRETKEIRWIRQGAAFDGWVLVRADKASAHFTCSQKGAPDCSYDVELYAARQSE